MARGVNAVDFWRGFALVTIFINHIPGVLYERFTHRNISLSDSAELFVFLAGWSLRRLIADPPPAMMPLQLRLLGRAGTIYAAHMTIVMIAIAMLATAARLLENPLLLEWHNAAAVFQNPADTHIGLVLLTHQLGYFDILPLYVVLMLVVAPLVAIVHRVAPNLLLPLSLAIYVSALVFRITLHTWPVQGKWFFNPFCWQLVFVLGFASADTTAAAFGRWIRTHIATLRMVAIPVLVVGAIMVTFGWLPDPTRVPSPKLLFIAEKSYVTPLRLVHFLAVVTVFSATFPWIAAGVPRLVSALSLLGRHSLYVFCAGSLLSLAGQILRFRLHGSLVLDTFLVLGGISIMSLVAWLAERRKTGSSR